MSESLNIKLEVEKYRAIKSAEINISGITVVTGENGCGKSTLSKMLYYIFKISISYDLLVTKDLKEKLQDIFRFINIAALDLGEENENSASDILRDLGIIYSNISNFNKIEKLQKDLLLQLDRIGILLSLTNKNTNKRLKYVVSDILEPKNSFNFYETINSGTIEKIKKQVDSIFDSAFKLLKSRNTSLLTKELEKIFHTNELPKKLEVEELDQVLLTLENNKLSLSYGVQNTIYIDTPMMLGEKSEHNPHWNELNNIIENNKYNSNNISSIIGNDILKGDVKYEDDIINTSNFSFSRKEDGRIFNLLDCATGIKSFSILQMLLKLGFINNKTLLVVDEPESNLHPQWIVEYARVIVLINKHIGTKFFIASHNPDFISAIRYISEKEGNLKDVRFYLAVKEEDFTYSYKDLGHEIDPIFKSFNIALDKIESYGI